MCRCPQQMVACLAGLLLATGSGRSSLVAQVRPTVIKQIDHVMILTRDREQLVRLLVDTLQLPIVWGQPGSAFTATTGIALGDMNLELVPRDDAADARLTSLALQPVHLATVCDELARRGLVLHEPTICDQEPGQRRWTVVGFRHAFEGVNFFLIQYLAFDMDARRAQFRTVLEERQGGPLGLRRVREFRLAYRPGQLAAAEESWRRLLGPTLLARPHYFALSAGPSIVLTSVPDSDATIIVVEVGSLSRAEATARSLGLLQVASADSLILDPRRFRGLRLILVEP